jgi:NAD(P)H-hydrate epimerase
MLEQILTNAAMKEADRRAIAAGTPGFDLLRRAGAAVAEAAERFAPPGGQVLVAAGPGNNGGDGFVAAAVLAARGFNVSVALLGDRDRLSGDAGRAAAAWSGPVLPLAEADPHGADVVIDALFGAGLSRDLEGEVAQAIGRMNASGLPIVAVDIPSGIDGDTGQVRGIAVEATRTVTFVTRKPGHLLLPGRAHCGPVEVADIGIGPDIVGALGGADFVNAPGLWEKSVPRPDLSAHKYDRGHTLVLSGGATRTGAARLAARAALRVGSGLVTLASPPEALGVNAAHLTAIMLRGCDGPEGLATILQDKRLNALVLGPALGVHGVTRAMVVAAVNARRGLVLDADALTSFEGFAPELKLAFRHAPTVMTPHDGEFSRLTKGLQDVEDGPSKLARARRAATHFGAVVVLKGADTVIASPDGRCAVNENGSPYLATAGAGDVLAGIVAGLLAQGLQAFEAAAAGVWIHAEAGARFGPGLIAEDLPETLPAVLRSLVLPGQG